MKTNITFIIFLTYFLTFFYGCQEKEKEEIKNPISIKEETQKNTSQGFNIKIKAITKPELWDYDYNFQIKNDYSSLDVTHNYISLKFPLAKNDFKFYKAYNISSGKTNALLFVITRKTGERLMNDNQRFMMNVTANITSVDELNYERLKKDKKLHIIVFYDKYDDFVKCEDAFIKHYEKCIEDIGYIESYKESKCLFDDDFCKKEFVEFVEPKESGGGVIQD